MGVETQNTRVCPLPKESSMKTFALLLSIVATAVAFTPSAPPMGVQRVATRGPRSLQMKAEMSPSVPFLVAPKNTKGLVGDVGFDPLYFPDFMDIKWMREAELKHGRICMLACLGILVQEFISVPGPYFGNPMPIEAAQQLPAAGWAQILGAMAFTEVQINKGKFTMMDAFEDGRAPGDFGFDPLKFSKEPEKAEKYALMEITHARLAMLGFSGMIHQAFITGKPTIAGLKDIMEVHNDVFASQISTMGF